MLPATSCHRATSNHPRQPAPLHQAPPLPSTSAALRASPGQGRPNLHQRGTSQTAAPRRPPLPAAAHHRLPPERTTPTTARPRSDTNNTGSREPPWPATTAEPPPGRPPPRQRAVCSGRTRAAAPTQPLLQTDGQPPRNGHEGRIPAAAVTRPVFAGGDHRRRRGEGAGKGGRGRADLVAARVALRESDAGAGPMIVFDVIPSSAGSDFMEQRNRFVIAQSRTHTTPAAGGLSSRRADGWTSFS